MQHTNLSISMNTFTNNEKNNSFSEGVDESKDECFSPKSDFLLKRRKEEKHYLLTNEDVLNELHVLKDQYYKDYGKNIIFKNKQKAEIAKKICNNYDLLFLFKKTIFRIKETNIVFIDYKFFKIYMNESIYNEFINYVLYLFDETILEYNSLVVQIDADTITPSAVERYKPVIVKFNERCVHTNYIGYLQKWIIYNVPTFIDSFVNILTIIIHPDILHSLEKYSKEESVEKLKELFRSS
jgi:hypothetical protein